MTDWTPIPTTLPEFAPFWRQYEWVLLATQVLNLAIPVIFLFAGLSPRLRSWSTRVASGRLYGTVTLFAAAYLAIAAIVVLPAAYLAQLSFFRAWSVPAPSNAEWLAGHGVGLVSEIAIASALAWIPYWFLRRNPRRWWLFSTAVLVPILVAGLVIYQMVLAPLWTTYRPMPAGPLAAHVQALGERCSISQLRVLVGGNDDATVIGLGPFNRIVVSEKFVHDLTEPEQVVNLAHELKHYLTWDSWQGIALIAAFLLGGLWLVDVLGRRLLVWFGHRWGFTGLADPASFPLVLFTLTALWLAAGLPLYNALQRHAELEADRFALELTHLNRAQGLLQIRYSKYTLNDYDVFYRTWMANHPSASERVLFANTYRPWDKSEPLRYGTLCRMP
jgi:STE24 endopeptidase